MNAKQELIQQLQEIINLSEVKCAVIKFRSVTVGKEDSFHVLKINYSPKDLDAFLDSLDFEYRDFFYPQLFGNVLFIDGTWLERKSIDTDEWWEHNSVPEIPIECHFNS